MGIEQQALLTTVDRLLRENGNNPEIVATDDKITLATQYVQLYAVQEHVLETTTRRLAQALGVPEDIPLEILVLDVETALKGRGLRGAVQHLAP